ncbi:MAG: ABC transporter ATP-binding protein [Deinococcota bacterium]
MLKDPPTHAPQQPPQASVPSRHSNASSDGPVVVRADNLSKTYSLGDEHVHALRDLSLEIKQGEFIAVMGPSGSGKSTLLHVLGLLETPDNGEVIIQDQHTSNLNDDALTALRRDKLGFVFQNFELIPNLNAKENILLPAEVAGKRKEAEQRLTKLAVELGISDRLHHRPKQLSGGQQQRVAIARALINEPALILADEPTGNLDSDTGRDVLRLLQDGVRRHGWTVVMVTHDPNAARFAGRFMMLQDGQIVDEGHTNKDLLATSV